MGGEFVSDVNIKQVMVLQFVGEEKRGVAEDSVFNDSGLSCGPAHDWSQQKKKFTMGNCLRLT